MFFEAESWLSVVLELWLSTANEFLWYFRVNFGYVFLECLKLVKSKEISNKACA